MAISYINTVEVDNIAKEMLSLTGELNTEINNLFKRFSEVPYITKEWVGGQAEFYFKTILANKKLYTDFVDDLKEIGYKLSKDSYNIQTCIVKTFNEENKKGANS